MLLDGVHSTTFRWIFYAIPPSTALTTVYYVARARPRAASRGFILLRILQLLVGLGFCLLVVVGYRSIRRRSAILGTIVALGILSRIIIGLTLFAISYLELPVAQSLQAGGGFWQIAVDASRYYTDALVAIEQGIFATDYEGFTSPFFVQILAIWLLLVGASPIAALMLNVCAYVATAVLIVTAYGPLNDRRRDLPCVVAVGAYSFWPAIFIHGTQPLKDDIFFALIAMVCVALLIVLRVIVYGWRAAGGVTAIATAFAVVVAGSFGLAGIRWYFPIIICGALVSVFALFLLRGRLTSLPFYVAGSASVVLAVWLAAGGFQNLASAFLFATGGESPLGVVRSLDDIPAALVEMMRTARTGFLLAAGNTNIATPLHDGSSKDGVRRRPQSLWNAVPGRAAANGLDSSPLSEVELATVRATPRSVGEHVVTATRGLAIVFVPISLLKATSFVKFDGGRGILPVADLDTIFQDVAIVTLLALVWRRRREIGTRMPFVAFCLILAGATAVLLGYVVTNYGTLFRMRPMMAIPLCVLVVALSPRGDAAGTAAKLRARLAI
jgi:hypothetical protein